MAMPAALRPERARPPASVKVSRSGPSSRRTLQHHRRFGAFALPVPVLGVDEAPRPRRLGQRDEAGAAVGIVVAGEAPPQFGPLGELQDLGAGVEQRHVLEGDPGALGDAAHLLDVGGLEALDDREVVANQRGDAGAVERQARELRRIVRRPLADALRRLPAVLAAALARRPGDLDQREGLDHGVLLYWVAMGG